MARSLGNALMPWQQHVADVALELDPETGRPIYREVGILVPRQQGKTWLLLALLVHRAIGFGPPHGSAQNILYTAQTGSAARTKFEKDFVPTLTNSPFDPLLRVRMSIGHESIRWNNGSWIAITSTTQSAGHGETVDLGIIDEAWAHQDERLEQSFKPAMLTRKDAQLWWTSTAGLKDSHYLIGKMETGRALVEADVRQGVAYFEWSADPRCDPAAPESWRSCMPALGHTISEETIAADFKSMRLSEFRRAYLNIPETAMISEWQVIKEPQWTLLVDPASTARDPVAFALDVTPERSYAAIGVAGRRGDGQTHIEVVDHKRGTGWVVARLAELDARWHPSGIAVDVAGPGASLITALEAVGLNVLKASSRDVAQACGQFFDAVTEGTIRHLAQPELASALSGAQKRALGDAWAWARRGSSVDICPLVAATLANWAYHTAAGQEYDLLSSVW